MGGCSCKRRSTPSAIAARRVHAEREVVACTTEYCRLLILKRRLLDGLLDFGAVLKASKCFWSSAVVKALFVLHTGPADSPAEIWLEGVSTAQSRAGSPVVDSRSK